MARSSSSSRWAFIVSMFAAAGAALVLVYLLSITTDNRGFYERHYTWLYWVNVAVAAVLGLVILLAAVRLSLRMWRGKFGSRLLFKLAAIFALVGVLPGALIYTVSYQFVSRSIETWFDVQVDGALAAGLNLGRTSLQTQVDDLAGKTKLAVESATSGERLQPLALERVREQLSAQSVALLGPGGQVLAAVQDGSAPALGAVERPTAAMLRQARSAQVSAQIEGLDRDPGEAGAVQAPRVRVLAWIPSANLGLANEERFLQITRILPPNLARDALAVQAAYRDYQQRALGREGLRQMYIGTLTLALILAVFTAVLLAAGLGHQLARPLLLLAEGVAQVARGNLEPKEVFASRDELGGLTRSFADMTQQLADARSLVQRSLGQVESAKAHLQTMLDNLTAGVIMFDAQGRIDTVNPGATRILRAPLSAHIGKPLAEVNGLAAFAQAIAQRFESHDAEPEAGERGHWQESFELEVGAGRAPLTLLVRGAQLPQGARLLVFDDITDVVSAQRSVAWAEVARRLAHEIKNPLTPIQLSAERLQHKLEPRLEGADQQMLAKSVATIVNQVQAMKDLVNEFRDYARLPSAKPAALDLNALVAEVLGLYGALQDSGRLSAQCEANLPQILGDASQLRQVIHNLVQNALDAVADRHDGRVIVRTQGARNDDGTLRAVRLKVIDNGPGFSEKVLHRAFEPYVTTKAKGTGLGLAVVRKIVEDHGARIRVRNRAGEAGADGLAGDQMAGAEVSISFSSFVPAGAPAPGVAAKATETDNNHAVSASR